MQRHDFRLLVFDWDGTLLDSVASIVACVEATLAELGQPPAREGVVRGAIGLGLRETVAAFCPGCDESLFERIVAVYGRLWHDRFASAPRLFPGVPELLDGLKGSGYLLAVATAKSRGGLDHDLERVGLAETFECTRTVSEAAGKPDPEMLLSILAELEVEPGESLMIGDTVHDLEMASRAAVPAVAVASGCEDRATLALLHPLACLDLVVELEAWLAARRRQGPSP